MKSSRSGKGSGIAEAVTAAFILIPLALCLVDLTVLVIANSMNDTAAKNAARAAANQGDKPTAKAAVDKSLASVQNSPIVKSIILDKFEYDKDAVTVQTKMVVALPVPFPGYSEMSFVAKDVEPVVY